MHITVVIPVYNRRELVRRTLDSLESQSDRNFRVVLVDNSSTDGTFEVLRRWGAATNLDVEVLSCPTPGAAAARNCGLERVTTPWTLFFDSDDVMLPGHIERLNEAIEADRESNLILFDVWRTDLDGRRRRIRAPRRFSLPDSLYHNLIHGALATQRYIAHTELLRRVGAWDATVRGWDDIELGTRLIATGDVRAITLDGEPSVEELSTPESITGTSATDNVDKYCHALDVIASKLPTLAIHPNRTDRQLLRNMVNVKRAVLAAHCTREGSPRGRELYRATLDKADRSWRPRIAFAYHWRRLGLRGAANIIWLLSKPHGKVTIEV